MKECSKKHINVLEAKYCKECGEFLPSISWSMWGKDAARSCFFNAGSPFISITPVVFSLKSEIPIILAGRFVVFIKNNQIQLIDIQQFFKGYSLSQHNELLYFSGVQQRFGLTSMYGSIPVFAEPYLYYVVDGAIQRIHVRMRKHETVLVDEQIHSLAAPAALVEQYRTMIVFILGKKFALLMTDRYHKFISNDTFKLFWGNIESKVHWHSPLYWKEHWIFLDASGRLVAMRVLDKPPFWEENPNFPATLSDQDSARFSPPSLVNDNIFVSYQSGKNIGIKQLNLNTLQIQNHTISNLDFYPDIPPMPYHHLGTFVSLDNGTRSAFIHSDSGTKINLDLENLSAFQMGQFIQIGNQIFILVKNEKDPQNSNLVAITPNFSGRKINARLIGKIPIPWSSIISFIYLPAKYYSRDCFLVQGKDLLILICSP